MPTIKIEAANRILASIESELKFINSVTKLNVKESQKEDGGFRLTHDQDKNFLKDMLKKYGTPEDWHQIKETVHRCWNIDGMHLCADYNVGENKTALLYVK
jgi:hypothetical protein